MFTKNQKKHILWDIDGTLFSSAEMIHRIYKKVFENTKENFGWPQTIPSLDEIVAEIGKPVKTIFLNLVPEVTEDKRDFLSLQILHTLVTAITFGEGVFYTDFFNTLELLNKRGYQFHAASNGRYPYVESILRTGNLIGRFSSVDCINNKDVHTKDELVASILNKFNLNPDEVVLIGDRHSDRQAAQKNNVDFIACRFGHGCEEEWQGAIAKIDSLNELLDILP